ncbi:Cytochrome c4 [Oligella ureolytica]|uniref:Cytochrome c4 n=2 Tax=Oligella ureolytica TaxID=90244 RepID=A0A378XHT3_9BURK|nr:c-type cytochrome [Oligella ureolytica]SUA55378.1 Cytochrome c4 [Oligella ureolytica]
MVFMPKKMANALLLMSGVLAVATATGAEVDQAVLDRGKEVSALCIACHMESGSGSSIEGFEYRPRLTGMNPDYMIHQIQSFRDGTRVNASMKPFADLLTDEQMHDVSHYYASLPAVKADDFEVIVSDDVLAHGKKLIYKGDWDRYIPACVACHGVDAYGIGVSFPNINGQNPAYLKKAINDWKEEIRSNDPLELMSRVAKRLTEKDIEAVAAYLASQPAVKED